MLQQGLITSISKERNPIRLNQKGSFLVLLSTIRRLRTTAVSKHQKRALIMIIIALLIAWGFTSAATSNGQQYQGTAIMLYCALAAFVIQWLVFLPSYLQQSERFYDLTGSLTYLTVTAMAVLLTPSANSGYALLLAAMVSIWAVRLGSFLFARILKDGKDSRFDDIKPSFIRFLAAWTVQGLWVLVTAGAALTAITSAKQPDNSILVNIGALVWCVGFIVEVLADRQKKQFRASPDNQHRFITTGLWGYSRHPNYFGEITLWTGIAIMAFPALSGWQYVTLISPLFVTLLLTKVSGIPMLEEKADKTWGDDPDYQEYKRTTPALVPKLMK